MMGGIPCDATYSLIFYATTIIIYPSVVCGGDILGTVNAALLAAYHWRHLIMNSCHGHHL